ncbi:hypothetical protein Tco_0167439 [Tanacetum coccineum]
MDLYHSRLTPDYLNDLIIKYKIPHDLHPWLPSEDFVMSELLDDAIGIYHLMFDFSGVQIPFSSLCANKKCGFFLIDRWAIPDVMVWRHPDAAIDDPSLLFIWVESSLEESYPVLQGVDGNVMGIHDFLCIPEWTGAEFQEEPHFNVRSTLQRLPFYYTPPAAADAVNPDPTLEDLATGTPSSKILAMAKASQKRKASTSASTSGYVAKRTRSTMDRLPADAIGIYSEFLRFSSVRVPFSTFILSVLKYFKVHISQLIHLGLNKVVSFEVVCHDLNIVPTVTFFRVFQCLCKQGDWFSFSKHRNTEDVCMDDGPSSLKKWKNKFFLIDHRVIPEHLTWRHSCSCVSDDLPSNGYDQNDVQRLCACLIRLCEMREEVLVHSGLSLCGLIKNVTRSSEGLMIMMQDSTAGENKGQREGKAPMLSEETPEKTKC